MHDTSQDWRNNSLEVGGWVRGPGLSSQYDPSKNGKVTGFEPLFLRKGLAKLKCFRKKIKASRGPNFQRFQGDPSKTDKVTGFNPLFSEKGTFS